jgi:hypothetical protein
VSDFRPRTAVVSVSSSGDNTVISSPSAGKTLVWKLMFSCSTAVNITFKDGSTVIGGPYVFTGTGSSMTLYYDGSPHFSANGDFIMNLSGSATVTGQVHYTQGG